MSGKKKLLKLYETRAVFENVDTGNCLVATQLKDGIRDITTCETSQLPDVEPPLQVVSIEAIYGLYDLLSGPYVAVVIESEPFVSKEPKWIRKVKKIIILPLFSNTRQLSSQKQNDEDRYLYLLDKAFSEHTFFFSPSHDLTQTQQKMAKFAAESQSTTPTSPLWTRADDRFFWNKECCKDFIACDADEWIVPFMSAYIEYIPDCEVEDDKFATLFISRRSRFRAGCRFTKRGIDDDGNVANFVETEQILLFPDGRVSSYVQIRGSIPIAWKSPVHMKYAPVVSIADNKVKNIDVCEKHVVETLREYTGQSGKTGVIFVNLIDGKKEQGRLGREFKEAIESIQAKMQQQILKYVWFDFHAECKQKGKWNNLSKLVNQVDKSFRTQGFFSKDARGNVISQQSGVLRTNCMDNLDRTNVVQSLFARRSLLMQLGKDYLLDDDNNILNSPFKSFEKIYKSMWANNANALAMLYAGTGALKVDFTKTGKRTLKGMFNDGVNSCMRYYINNFTDGIKQDSIDLLLGNYKPHVTVPSPFTPRAGQETLASNFIKAFVLCMIIFSLLLLFSPRHLIKGQEENYLSFHLLSSFAITSMVMMYMFYLVVKKGSRLGDKLVVTPQLIPVL